MRRRGTAIIETDEGILVAAGKGKIFLLPGGNAKMYESRRRAAIRELKEETTLEAYSDKYLFSHVEPKHQRYRASHKVFLIKAHGTPKLNHHDVSHIDYWRPGSKITLSKPTQKIINRYLLSR